MQIRTKFQVTEKTETAYGYHRITLTPVCSGSQENKDFWSATPGGKIEFNAVNQKAIDAFQVGKEYYVDFTLAEVLKA
jgi:hypothetical protein